MPERLFRILAALPGVLLLAKGLGVVLAPRGTLGSLGMPLFLDTLGRSSQIADVGTLFLTAAGVVLLGAAVRWLPGLWVGAAMMTLAAVLRVAAWALHGAAFPVLLIGVELALGTWLGAVALVLARRTPQA